uniref:EGF-like domain-containing protein n=1 Tax=Panagrolaimus sp. ES5 TaxID=591445 RepID=A0AC34FG07_9BILA
MMFIFKFLFIFACFSTIYSAQITYTIEVHTIKTDEPYKAVFLEEDDDLLITCGQENVKLKNLVAVNKSENNDDTVLRLLNNPFRLTFRSIFHNGNVILCGGKSETTGEEMTGVVRLLTVLNKPFYNSWLSCEDKGYCQNHGQCYRDPENHATKICVCSSYFGGLKCQNMVAGMHLITEHVVVPSYKITDANTFTFVIIIIFMALGMFFIGGLAYYYRHNHKQEKKLRSHLICAQCNTKRCDPKSEDETQTPEGNLKTNNHKEYNKLPQNDP